MSAGLDLTKYRGSELLSDAGALDEPGSLLRVMMTVAWTSGFISANRDGGHAGSVQDLKTVADFVSDVAKSNPDEYALVAITRQLAAMS